MDDKYVIAGIDGDTDSDVFTVSVSDGTASAVTQTYTVNVSGANDAALVTGDDAGEISEDSDPNTVSGNLNSTDVDAEDADDSWQAATIASVNGGIGDCTPPSPFGEILMPSSTR